MKSESMVTTLVRVMLIASVAAWVACAGSSTELLYSTSLAEMPKPPVLLVDTFSFQPDTVTIDESGPSLTSDGGSQAKRTELGKAVAEAVATKIVVELGKVGVESRRLEQGSAPPTDALLAKGQFVEINEGDQMSRVTLGFGAGTEELRARIQLYHVDENGGLRRIRESIGEAHGDKMPGMAVPVAAGAAGGTIVVSAAVSGGLNVLSEMNTGLDEAAQNLAEQLAERAKKIYEDHGWLD